MFQQTDIARLAWDRVKVAHCRFPPSEARRLVPVSEPGAVAIGYNGQRRAVIRLGNGRTITRDIPPGTTGLTGEEPVYWLRTRRSSEVLELTASPTLRREIAESLKASAHVNLADMHGWADRQIWAILDRFRAASRRQVSMSDVECEYLVRRLYTRVYCTHFGGKMPAWREQPLDRGRLDRVLQYIEWRIDADLSLEKLARVAAYSTFHFARAFKLSTGWSPHQFVMSRRIEHARALLLRGDELTVESIARRSGFDNLSHFRRLFRARLGLVPSRVRETGR